MITNIAEQEMSFNKMKIITICYSYFPAFYTFLDGETRSGYTSVSHPTCPEILCTVETVNPFSFGESDIFN